MIERRARRRQDDTFLDEVGRDLTHLGATILNLAEVVARQTAPSAAETPLEAQQVGFLISMRHTRSAVFGLDLTSPGWSVLLELYRARLEGRTVRISRLAADAGIPSTTALRWLEQLCERGLAERRPDRRGGRGVVVRLSEEGAVMMSGHFATMKAGWTLG